MKNNYFIGLQLFLSIVSLNGISSATPFYYTFEVNKETGRTTNITQSQVVNHKYIFLVDTERKGVQYGKTGNIIKEQFFARLLDDDDLRAIQPKYLPLMGVALDSNDLFDASRYGNILEDEYSKDDFASWANYLGQDYGQQRQSPPYSYLESSQQGSDKNYVYGYCLLSIGKTFIMNDYGQVVKKVKVGDSYKESGDVSWLQTEVRLTHITPIPEPSTVVLLGVGVVGLIGRRVRCNKRR